MEKVYLNEHIWVIDNFLTQEELDWFRPWIDDPKDWYITMRSPYKNIMNKFIGAEPEYDADGNIMMPSQNSKYTKPEIFEGIWSKLESVLPKHYVRHSTLQSFKYMTDEEIKKNIDPNLIYEEPVDFAMQLHEDKGADVTIFNASFSLYLNDDFEGGELYFRDLDLTINPKAGRLVCISVADGLTHRVNKIKSGNSRHTLYGNSWNKIEDVPMSTSEDC